MSGNEKTKRCTYCGERILAIAVKCKHCGSMLEEKSSTSATTIIEAFSSHYEIIEEIGRGGMAVVYKARQKSLNRIVALKIVPKEFTIDNEFVIRFNNEAREASKLNHPNIITIYDSGEIMGYPFIAMEYLEGGTLSNRVSKIRSKNHKTKRKGILKENEIKELLIPILKGLNYAHKKGIIHRDIKSSNIMFDSEGRPILMDFGIAKSEEAPKLTIRGTYIGTPEYSSPEQADSKKNIDHRTDIYSLGVVAYELATGEVPFKGENPITVLHHVIHNLPRALISLNPGLSQNFSNAIMKAIEKDPANRFENCNSFMVVLKSDAKITLPRKDKVHKTRTPKTRIPKAKKPKISHRSSRSNKKNIFLVSIILLILIIIVSTFFYFNGNSGTKGYLRNARSCLHQGKFIEPEKDNALFYANLILDIDNNNSKAKDIIRQIAKHYEIEGDNAANIKLYQEAISSYYTSISIYNNPIVTAKLNTIMDESQDPQQHHLQHCCHYKYTHNSYFHPLLHIPIQPQLVIDIVDLSFDSFS